MRDRVEAGYVQRLRVGGLCAVADAQNGTGSGLELTISDLWTCGILYEDADSVSG